MTKYKRTWGVVCRSFRYEGGGSQERTTPHSPLPYLLGTLAVLLGPRPIAAQVGHDPGGSPYHDVRRGSIVRVIGGYINGERGKIPIAPADGPTGGLRYEYQATNFLTLAADIAYARTDAFYFNPNDSAPQKLGPVSNDFVVFDVGVQASLTGGKTFHGFQPYVGAAGALVFGSSNSLDSSGYDFGSRLGLIPEIGLRWYPARRLSFEVSSRFLVYRLYYPLSYRPKLLSISDPLREWTIHPWAMVGLGWTF